MDKVTLYRLEVTFRESSCCFKTSQEVFRFLADNDDCAVATVATSLKNIAYEQKMPIEKWSLYKEEYTTKPSQGIVFGGGLIHEQG